MKREIKFRAWDKEKNIMLDVLAVEVGMPKGHNTIHPNGSDYMNEEECELMQYTGLKDKNGKEIYEGDIVSKTMSVGGGNKERFGEMVEWDYSKLGRRAEDYKKNWEVIGNIWENGDLLLTKDGHGE